MEKDVDHLPRQKTKVGEGSGRTRENEPLTSPASAFAGCHFGLRTGGSIGQACRKLKKR